MFDFEPKDRPRREVHQILLGGVGPRPIALVSTLSRDGTRNLSPFSFFNAFGANPPTVAFSASRRGRDGSFKDTYKNLMDTRECVIQAVTYSMVQQVNLASTEYPSDADEFVKSGLTPIPSDIVKPFRVQESPFQMECVLNKMVPLGDGPASGNLAICEVVKFHVAEDIILNGIIEPDLIDLVGRNSADYYTRASGKAIFAVAKPITGHLGVGFDQLPEQVKLSHVLSANNLAQLANAETIPDADEVISFIEEQPQSDPDEGAFYRYMRLARYQEMLSAALALERAGHPKARTFLEQTIKFALDENNLEFAWNVVVYLTMARPG